MITMRFSAAVWDVIRSDVGAWAPRETTLVVLAKRVALNDDLLYLVDRGLVLADDEAVRTPYRTHPTDPFLWPFYTWAKQARIHDQGYEVCVIHSHPFAGDRVPSMSGIDWCGMADDAAVYEREFPGARFVRLVVNRDCSAYEGWVVGSGDRRRPESVEQLAVLSAAGLQQFTAKGGPAVPASRERFARQLLIPGFDLERLARLRIGLVGLGGVGSKLLQEIVALGIGRDRPLVLCDPDVLEESNLSRIPYATPADTGRSKAEVAAGCVTTHDPGRVALPVAMSCMNDDAQQALATCDVLLAGVDAESVRYALNHLAASFLVPLFDCSAGVTVDEVGGTRIAVPTGTVRRFLPGVSPCLLCNGGLDFARITSEVVRGTASEEERETLRRAGYLQDLLGEGAPEPSVSNLNSMVASAGITFLLEWLLGGEPRLDALHLDLGAYELLRERAAITRECRFCGDPEVGGAGELGAGVLFDVANFARQTSTDDLPPPPWSEVPDSGLDGRPDGGAATAIPEWSMHAGCPRRDTD